MITTIINFLFWFLLTRLQKGFMNKDYMTTEASIRFGMAFDLFNLEIFLYSKSIWKKAVLIIHLVLVATTFGCKISLNDK